MRNIVALMIVTSVVTTKPLGFSVYCYRVGASGFRIRVEDLRLSTPTRLVHQAPKIQARENETPYAPGSYHEYDKCADTRQAQLSCSLCEPY